MIFKIEEYEENGADIIITTHNKTTDAVRILINPGYGKPSKLESEEEKMFGKGAKELGYFSIKELSAMIKAIEHIEKTVIEENKNEV